MGHRACFSTSRLQKTLSAPFIHGVKGGRLPIDITRNSVGYTVLRQLDNTSLQRVKLQLLPFASKLRLIATWAPSATASNRRFNLGRNDRVDWYSAICSCQHGRYDGPLGVRSLLPNRARQSMLEGSHRWASRR